jgi:DnaK suppressor protein
MDELSDAQLEAFRLSLMQLQGELQVTLIQSRESAQPVDVDAPIGRLTRMDAMQDQKLAQANKARLEVRLKQIASALRRIESGDFGFCLVCEEAIDVKRIEARPESPLCLGCQSTRETNA